MKTRYTDAQSFNSGCSWPSRLTSPWKSFLATPCSDWFKPQNWETWRCDGSESLLEGDQRVVTALEEFSALDWTESPGPVAYQLSSSHATMAVYFPLLQHGASGDITERWGHALYLK